MVLCISLAEAIVSAEGQVERDDGISTQDFSCATDARNFLDGGAVANFIHGCHEVSTLARPRTGRQKDKDLSREIDDDTISNSSNLYCNKVGIINNGQ